VRDICFYDVGVISGPRVHLRRNKHEVQKPDYLQDEFFSFGILRLSTYLENKA
jgi:hypothetical protein